MKACRESLSSGLAFDHHTSIYSYLLLVWQILNLVAAISHSHGM